MEADYIFKKLHRKQSFPNSFKEWLMGTFAGREFFFIGLLEFDEEWFWPFEPFSKLKITLKI